jgi:hypothetical protein
MRYEFKCFETDVFGQETNNVISTSFHADTLELLLERFEYFLKGNGFHFDGKVDIVSEEEEDNDKDPIILGKGGPSSEHSPLYYDFDRNRPYGEDLGAAQSTLKVDLPEQYNFNIDGNVFGSDYDIIIGEPNER